MFNDTIIYEYQESRRTIVIGDIHGDLKRLKNILIDAKIINNNIEWIANPSNTIVIQLGDQIDSLNRSENAEEWEVLKDIDVIYFTNNLSNIARSKGGNFISLIGNHELMNVCGNFSYVTKNSNFELRHNLFKPNGSLSSILAKRPLIAKIGNLFFCHAGIKKEHLDLLEKYDKPVSYINDIWKQYITNNTIDIEDKELFDKIIINNDGLLWTRNMDNDNDMNTVLNKLDCVYMFFGHNLVSNVTLYNEKIWFTDNGISRAFGTSSYEYIDIDNFIINIKKIIE